MAIADKQTVKRKKQIIYSDITTDFGLNPVTGILSRVTNENSIGQSLKNLTLTSYGERFFDSNKGSPIQNALFDLYDPTRIEFLKVQLRNLYENYEPRAIIYDIRIEDLLDSNAIGITVVYGSQNLEGEFEILINIQRVR